MTAGHGAPEVRDPTSCGTLGRLMRRRKPIRKWVLRIGKVVVFLGALGLTYGLFSFVGLQLALKTREVSVPNLSGLTSEEAEALLANADLAIRVEPLRRIHQTIEAGRVAEQDPRAGLATRRRRTVKIWLSSGHTPGSVPMLIGASENSARRRLEENAFALASVSEIASSRYPTDAVVAQDPPPSAHGQAVSLLVNRGERGRTYVMPDLIGVSGARAAEILRTRGFRVTVVGEHPYPGLSSGIVLRQSPQAGFQIAPGEPISLEVSR